ncbi:MAG: acetate--CoA ligase [Synechococcaceae bacterium WBA_2_066]|nr:acetate--CoA ligase [Synechococcaceae bacterium WB6_1A_059]NBP31839.1 acetate--CoA ligase [Synechococcaceae bacterium WB6_1B_055]NBP98157.1 acetate--CoA ligase [Synechococcaceae bacterium WB6_3A_227]NBQ18406.1 acetate--CoA ligase [Synechococcaceae bacterium WB5_2A_257]NBR43812.1 acetate--CoA ligase [Synechococcaceae bacterium WB5_2B_268]NCU76252.1 acetate--CoA ligase [Synechococcaceae bacterium WB7_1C_051]NCU91829.1 acetate--CoA ligase [Synechococcaceae bacterium WB7_1B_046]NCY13784.1 ace
MTDMAIESVLKEERTFDPPAELSQSAAIGSMASYRQLVEEAEANPELFWGSHAKQELHWFSPFSQVLDWTNPPFARWFEGGTTNISYNCLDRHLQGPRADKKALIWEGEPGDSRIFTYRQLHHEVCKAANALKALGVERGDLVALYMPMLPEAAIAMLACARIGAAHSVVFGGFSAEALRDRLNDGKAKMVITADGGFRKDKAVGLKLAVDDALSQGCESVQKVLVVQRTKQKVGMQNGRDHWWHDSVDCQSSDCDAEPMNSEDRLFVLYTSGSTGKPKGVVHTTAGYNLWAHLTFKWIFDLKETDIHWCTADVGWITGHSYIVYGPLSNGATTLMYEGAPRASSPGAFWQIIEKHKVSLFYTAPTAIRAFMKSGRQVPDQFDMSSLRILGSVGEPINPEAWMWYRDVIGSNKCPIVDTWWQTETGGVMISPLAAATPTKPGSATLPLPGITAAIMDGDGNLLPANQGGYLVILKPWPGMMRTLQGDPERFRSNYWSYIKPADGSTIYFAGDGARRDESGYYWVMGRVDDVINVSGHRLGSMEIESALVSHPAVAEAAVVGRFDDLKGEAIVAFVTLQVDRLGSKELEAELRAHVGNEIGPIAKPDQINFTDSLPKTRSGKIMRRILRALASGEEISGDTSTLEDRSVLDQLRNDA